MKVEVLAITHPELFTLSAMAVTVEPDGKVRGVADPASVIHVVTDVDADAAHTAHTAFMRSLGCCETDSHTGAVDVTNER